MAELLIAGGGQDPNLPWLQAAAERMGVACRGIFVDNDQLPRFTWTVGEPAAVDGISLDCRPAFIRYDVFTQLKEGTPSAASTASAWFAAVNALCNAAGTFTFNRDISSLSASKPAMLSLAAKSGFRTPRTLVSNSRTDVATFAGTAPAIAKPVAGGSYAMPLPQAVAETLWEAELSPSPAIVQPMLAYPERRIYQVGPEVFAFDIASATLDSRLDPNIRITAFDAATLPREILDALRDLTDRLRCDFCAVDMKSDPETGELVFLELNNGPMFKAYDKAAGGTMAEAMVRYLIAGGAAQAAGLGGS